MRTIWKYPFPVEDEFSLELPDGAEMLYVGVQNDVPCLWCLVDPVKPTHSRPFRLVGTGHPLADGEVSVDKYVGSFMLNQGALVFHLFEVGE